MTTRALMRVGRTSRRARFPVVLEKPCRTNSIMRRSALCLSSSSVASRSLSSTISSPLGSRRAASSSSPMTTAGDNGKGGNSSSTSIERDDSSSGGASDATSPSYSPVSRKKVNSIGKRGLAARTAAPTSPGRTGLPLISINKSPMKIWPHSADGVPSLIWETELSLAKPMPSPPCAGRKRATVTRCIMGAPRSTGAAGGSIGLLSGSSERASTDIWRARPSNSAPALESFAPPPSLLIWRRNVSPMTANRLLLEGWD
mmetsp:Transcript_17322/g.43538  ORF Transcript_17322/g.43538 Transcript_17322/m.43538 type:complete len:258 (-) Transcript_17322:610-1383(-)